MKRFTITGAGAAAVVLTMAACTAPAVPVTPTPAYDLPTSVAAIGDSISQAAQADGTPGNQPANSWSTGQGGLVDSLAERIRAMSGSSVTVTNAAVSGATSEDLAEQAARVVTTGAEFVTVLAGNNDLCNAQSVAALPAPAEYSANVRAALVVLAEGLPESMVLLASMPSLGALYSAGRGDAEAKYAWSSYGVCPIALADPDSTAAVDVQRRTAVDARVTEMNAALASVAAEFDTVLFDDGAAQNVEFELTDLSSFDFFHPSVKGQNLLVDAEWEVISEAGLFEAGI
jgi:lysophospholipase L1-like esterase